MSLIAKIAYIFLFLALLADPYLITGHIFSIPEAYAQSIITVIILALAYGIYLMHQKDIQKKERELGISGRKLINAFEYIASVNRRLPLLKNITTDLLKRDALNKKDKKNIFHDLLATAVVSIIKADWGMFRFIDSGSGKTVKEFVYSCKQYALLKTQISNQQLFSIKDSGIRINTVKDLYVVQASDRNSAIQCFMIFPKVKARLDDEFSVLQSIVDQAQLFYKYLY